MKMSFFEPLKPVVLFSTYVVLSCLGLYLLKVAPVWLSLRFGLGCLLYALGAAMWLVILRHYALSLAFPVAAGALTLGTSLVGIFCLGETLTRVQVVGMLVILVGITMLSRSPTP